MTLKHMIVPEKFVPIEFKRRAFGHESVVNSIEAPRFYMSNVGRDVNRI